MENNFVSLGDNEDGHETVGSTGHIIRKHAVLQCGVQHRANIAFQNALVKRDHSFEICYWNSNQFTACFIGSPLSKQTD